MTALMAENTIADRVVRIERHCAAAWPAIHTEELGGWEMRFSPGLTSKRVNSLNATMPDSERFPDILRRARELCSERGARCHVRLTPLAGPECAPTLESMGVFGVDETRVQMVDLAGRGSGGSNHVTLASTPHEGWLAAYAEMHGDGPEARHSIGALLDRVTMPQRFASIGEDGRLLAVGRAACGEGLAGIFQIMTRPEARKRGLARALMAALLEWCGSNGGKQAYLQVEAANMAACSLYASLGFEDLYRYTYWTMPLGEQRIIG